MLSLRRKYAEKNKKIFHGIVIFEKSISSNFWKLV